MQKLFIRRVRGAAELEAECSTATAIYHGQTPVAYQGLHSVVNFIDLFGV